MRQTSRVVTFLALFALLPSAAQAASYTYVVSAGDTLSKIAREHQITVDDIMQQNQLSSDRLAIGQTLTLSGTGANYVPPAAMPPEESNREADSIPSENTDRSIRQKARVVADVLRVRQAPSMEGDLLGKLYYGNQVELLEHGTEWSKIRYEQGEAYVASEYLSLKDLDSDDVTDPDDIKRLEDLEELVAPLLGTTYVLGGTTPDGFDCSGFTSYVFDKLGVTLPRTSEEQFLGGISVSLDEAKPGDLLFYDSLNKGRVSHVAIYLGNDRVVHANGDDVRYGKMEYMHKLYPFYGVKRYLTFE